MGETRKLAAILVADVVGYSRLAAADEDRTLYLDDYRGQCEASPWQMRAGSRVVSAGDRGQSK
jgi:class 3 adenylate cyclase